MSVDAKIMTAIVAIRHALQTSCGPGSSVNSHPNPFFLNVAGEVNLKHIAELVIARLEAYENEIQDRIDKLLRENDAKRKAAEAANAAANAAANDTSKPA